MISVFRHNRYRHSFFACTAFCALLLLSSFARAQDTAYTGDLYTVEGVEVDATAANAVEAREKAFEEAQVKAFAVLASRMLSEDEMNGFAPPPVEEISAMVQDYEVTQEQLSTIRYKGTYTIRFRPEAARTAIASGGIRGNNLYGGTPGFQDTEGALLVLPFFQDGRNTALWGRNNPFMVAWVQSKAGLGDVPTVVPMGDLLDVSQIRDNEAFGYDPALLQKMLERYRARDAVILIAQPEAQQRSRTGGYGAGAQNVNIGIYRAGIEGPELIKALSVRGRSGEREDSLYARAVDTVREALGENRRPSAGAYVDPLQKGQMKARALFSSAKEWVQMKAVIEAVPGVKAVRVVSLKSQEARLDIAYSGTEDRMRLAFQQAGIVMGGPQAGSNPWDTDPVYDLYLSTPKQTY